MNDHPAGLPNRPQTLNVSEPQQQRYVSLSAPVTPRDDSSEPGGDAPAERRQSRWSGDVHSALTSSEAFQKFANASMPASMREDSGASSVEKVNWPAEASAVTESLVFKLVNLLKVYGAKPTLLRRVFTFANLSRLIRQIEKIFAACPNVVPVVLEEDVTLTIVGDTHGQFYDVLHLFELNGWPSPRLWYLFNGDYVDRGSWGLELTVTLFAFKILYPNCVHLLRGNHETLYCTNVYGFENECKHKYSKSMLSKFQNAFARMPLASCVLPHGSCVPGLTDPNPDDIEVLLEDEKAEAPEVVANGVGIFVIHGGLFRNIDGSLGTIRSLQEVKRYVKDPDGDVLLDVLWSDPQPESGIFDNTMRGCATLFGPDITAEFLRSHGLSLFVRSHEGPDAREKRPYLSNTMMEGYAIDHVSEDGQPLLITLFSAPDYPQGPRSRGNTAAFLRISGDSPSLAFEIVQFGAAPHPIIPSYYTTGEGGEEDLLTEMET